MLEILVFALIGYGGFVGWTWWLAPIAGAIFGVMIAIAKIRHSAWVHNPSRFKVWLQSAFPIMVIGGAAMGTAYYFIGRLIARLTGY